MRLGSYHVILAVLLALASLRLSNLGPFVLWGAADLMLVGLAYFGPGPGIFGKRPDGSTALWAVVLLFPYLLVLGTVWQARRVLFPATPFQELIPGILIGRRLFPHEYPASVACVVDLTCEMPEYRKVARSKRYLSLPILDGHVPKPRDLLDLVRQIDDTSGTTYIHCAEGYGRTGMVAAAILLARGLARDVDEAVGHVQRKRPGVRLRRAQRQAVAQVAQALGATEPTHQPSREHHAEQ